MFYTSHVDRRRRYRFLVSLTIFWSAPFLAGARAKLKPPPQSAYRRYVWGARDAFAARDFSKAKRLLEEYRDAGSPSDRLLVQAGCHPKVEVERLEEAVRAARSCMKNRPSKPSWNNGERAKLAIATALKVGDGAVLEPFVDCAPRDLTAQSGDACEEPRYLKPEDIRLLVSIVNTDRDLWSRPDWREIPEHPGALKPGQKSAMKSEIRWALYTLSEHWKPCGMPGAPLLELRRDPDGTIRIASFPGSCLETK